MRNALLLFSLCFAFGPLYSQDLAPYSTAAQDLLEAAVKAEECVGLSAGFATDGAITWASTAGWKNLDQAQAFTSSTLTRTASIAKPMTAIAVLQLYEQGKIDLDEAVKTYVPDFPNHPTGVITVRHLLQHASGIQGYRKKESSNRIYYPNLTAAAQVFWERELGAIPGERFLYSSYGYVVLGVLIERVSGMSYEAYLQKNIWDKAGMKNTGVEQLSKSYPDKSELYHLVKKGKIKWVKQANDLSNRIPGGGFHTTAEDLLHFGNALIQHQLIKASTITMMWEDSGLKKEGNPYGLGWFLYGKNEKYGMVYGHGGGQTGCSSQLMVLPDAQTVVVVLGNTSGARQSISTIAIKLFDIAAAARKQ